MPTKALDSGDIAAIRSRANRSGRSYGGAPLNDDRNGGYQGRGGRNGGGYNGGGGNPINYANPFAAHLNPNFVPGAGRGLPPQFHDAARPPTDAGCEFASRERLEIKNARPPWRRRFGLSIRAGVMGSHIPRGGAAAGSDPPLTARCHWHCARPGGCPDRNSWERCRGWVRCW